MNASVLSSPPAGDLGGSDGGGTGETASPPKAENPATMRRRRQGCGGDAAEESAMEARKPVRLAVAQFEDLVARGLRALVAEDVNIELVADEVPHEQLEKLIAPSSPDVALLNFGSLRSPNDVARPARAAPRDAAARPRQPPLPLRVQSDARLRRDGVPVQGDPGARHPQRDPPRLARPARAAQDGEGVRDDADAAGRSCSPRARPTCSSCSSWAARTPRSPWR